MKRPPHLPADQVEVKLEASPKLRAMLEVVRSRLPGQPSIEDAARIALAALFAGDMPAPVAFSQFVREARREARIERDYLLDHGDAKHGTSPRPTLFASRGVRAFHAQMHHPAHVAGWGDHRALFDGPPEHD